LSKDAQVEIASMLEAGGCKNVAREGWGESAPGFAVHEVGTARMGDRPGNSVLNKYCQAWEAPNLFVVDGAAWPSSACQNPLAAPLLRNHAGRVVGRIERAPSWPCFEPAPCDRPRQA
jgi:choline dehydrogenase-like flavoprotein